MSVTYMRFANKSPQTLWSLTSRKLLSVLTTLNTYININFRLSLMGTYLFIGMENNKNFALYNSKWLYVHWLFELSHASVRSYFYSLYCGIWVKVKIKASLRQKSVTTNQTWGGLCWKFWALAQQDFRKLIKIRFIV